MRYQLMFLTVFLCLSLFCTTGVFAQEYVNRSEMEALRSEVAELKKLVSDMKTVITHQDATIRELQSQTKTDMAHPVAEGPAEHDADEASHAKGFDLHEVIAGIRPNISVTGDFVANLSDDHHIRTEEDRFDLRGVDIDFIGEIDGIGMAYANIAYHDDDVDLEEAYLIARDFLPLKTDLKLGKFRVDFGLLNTIHPHALPQVDYPAIYREYLGHEGYADEGLGIAGQASSPWGSPFKYSLQAVNGNRHDHDADHEDSGHDDESEYKRLKDFDDIVYVARLRNGVDLAETAKMQWGLSGLTGKFEDDDASPRFYYEGADLTLTWRPFKEPHRYIRLQSEVLSAQIEEGSSWERSYGLYSFLEYRFAERWLAGLRYDYAELPLRSGDHLREYSAYLTHRYSDNIGLRLQFKSARRNFDKDTNEVFLQWVFTLGKHRHLDDDDH